MIYCSVEMPGGARACMSSEELDNYHHREERETVRAAEKALCKRAQERGVPMLVILPAGLPAVMTPEQYQKYM